MGLQSNKSIWLDMLAFLSFLLFLPSGYAWYEKELRFAAEELIPLDKLVEGIKSARNQRFTFDAKFRVDYCQTLLLCPAALWEVCNNGGGTCTTRQLRRPDPRTGKRIETCTVKVSRCKTSPQYQRKSRQQIVDEIKSSKQYQVNVKFHVDKPEDCFHSKFCGDPSFIEEANPIGVGYCEVDLLRNRIPALDNQHGCRLSMTKEQLPNGTEGFLTAQDIKTRTSINKFTKLLFKVRQESDCQDMCDEDICPNGYPGTCYTYINDFPKACSFVTYELYAMMNLVDGILLLFQRISSIPTVAKVFLPL